MTTIQGRFVAYETAREVRDSLRAEGRNARLDFDSRGMCWVVSYDG